MARGIPLTAKRRALLASVRRERRREALSRREQLRKELDAAEREAEQGGTVSGEELKLILRALRRSSSGRRAEIIEHGFQFALSHDAEALERLADS